MPNPKPEGAIDLTVNEAKFTDVLNGWTAIYTANGIDINLSPEVTKAVVAAFVADEEARRGVAQ